MKLVIIESPYAGDVALNLRYLRAALRDSLSRGEAPYASHALYTQEGVLDDTVHAERVQGIAAGFAWWHAAGLICFYTDLGMSRGMWAALDRCGHNGSRKPYEFRTIPDFVR